MAISIPGYMTTYERLRPGIDGKTVQHGSTVIVHAEGTVLETGKRFWSTTNPGQQPFAYKAGEGAVIIGWDQGCLGMCVGEQRKLSIPSAEGYGARGYAGWGIPPNSTLEFTLHCIDIR